MATQNSIYAPTPFATAKGGTGNTAALTNGQLWVGNTGNVPTPATLTGANGIAITNGAGTITVGQATTLTNGQLWVGNTGNVPSAATITAGAGVNVTNGAGTITIAAPASDPSATVLANPTSSQTLAPNTTYICTNTTVGITTFTLPIVPVAGDFYYVVGGGSLGWKIAQNATQQVFIGAVSTTAGTGGSVNSTTTGGSSNESIIIWCQSATVFLGIVLGGQVNLI